MADQEFRELEATLAYEQASVILSSDCMVAGVDGLFQWLDTRSAEDDVTDHVRYLHARRLLDIHPKHPHWVSVRDESEPLPETDEAMTDNRSVLAKAWHDSEQTQLCRCGHAKREHGCIVGEHCCYADDCDCNSFAASEVR